MKPGHSPQKESNYKSRMTSETILLSDGRRLAYSQTGDPDGIPVFFFHGTPGSRYFHPPGRITLKHGVRLITVDRPGYGRSTFQPNRKILDWPKDILRLAENLELGRFHVAGHSGGGPYVLACTHELPERINSAAVISSLGPVEAISLASGLSTLNRFGLTYGRYFPWWIWKLMISIVYQQRSKDPLGDMNRQTIFRPQSDTILLNDPEIRENCLQSEIEAFKPGLAGLAWDAWLLTKPWGFSLETIKIPVWVWHGTADNQAPLPMANFVAERIPSSNSRFLPGEGHLLLFKFWDEILQVLLSKTK